MPANGLRTQRGRDFRAFIRRFLFARFAELQAPQMTQNNHIASREEFRNGQQFNFFGIAPRRVRGQLEENRLRRWAGRASRQPLLGCPELPSTEYLACDRRSISAGVC